MNMLESGTVLAFSDRMIAKVKPISLLIDKLSKRVLPHATAKACHGGYFKCEEWCLYNRTCQWCYGGSWAWSGIFQVVYDTNQYLEGCDGVCTQCGRDACFGGVYSPRIPC